MNSLLREGDIYATRQGRQYFIHKVLRLETGKEPVMHIMTRGPLAFEPAADHFDQYPRHVNHRPVSPLNREEVQYLGNRPVLSHDLEGYLHYLKSTDYDAYLRERGQDPKLIYTRAGKDYERGIKLFGKEDFEAAMRHFDKALELYPALHIARLARGYCRLALDNLEGAWDDLEIASQHFSSDQELTRLLVYICLERSQPDLASRYLRSLLKENPSDPELLMYKGYIHLDRSEFEDAWDAFQLAWQYAPQEEAGQYLFHFACYHAARYERDAALEWLELSLLRGFRDMDTLKRDRHLRTLQGSAAFQELLRKYFP